MRIKLQFFICFLLSCYVGKAYTQDSTATNKLKAFAQQYVAFSKNYPREKVYIHFDNTSYYLDETIWFKAYVVRADRHSLSELSKVLYVELINQEGYIVSSKKLKIEGGQCHDSFYLPAAGYAGFYEIRAYTRYMLNFSEENYFSRVLPVYDKPKKEGDYAPTVSERPNSQRIPLKRPVFKQKDRISITFYPEGGNLIQGLKSRVAFKTTGDNGENLIVAGNIVDEKNQVITDIYTEYLGAGAFEFTPGPGKYVAKISYNNRDYTFELPAALPEGYTMYTNNSDSTEVNIKIQRSPNIQTEPLGLSISCRGILYAFEIVNLTSESEVDLTLPKNMLPSGVSQITLFNPKGEILSERLIFTNHQSEMKITMSQNKNNFQPFEQVSMSFQLNDRKNNPVQTSFSLAVRDAGTSSVIPYADNALTNLLLSSELRGYIENPGYYFESNDFRRKQAMELLLLTQGWKRYEWKEMTGVKPFNPVHPLEKELAIEGSVVSLLRKSKLKDVELMMVLMSDSSSQRGKARTDKEGKFGFLLQDFYGDAKIILQSKLNDRRRETRIMLDRNFSPDPKSFSNAELNEPRHMISYAGNEMRETTLDTHYETDSIDKNLSMSDKMHVLKDLIVTAKQRPIKISVKYDVAKEMDKIQDTGDWSPADIYNFLDKMNQYFSYANDSGSSTLKYKGKKVYFMRDDSPDLVAFNIESLMSGESTDLVSAQNDINTSMSGSNNAFNIQMPVFEEIESINIIEDYGSILRLFGGDPDYDPTKVAIVVMHLKKNYRKEPLGIRNTTFSGFSYPKEFFNPLYNNRDLPVMTEADYRRTLYWNPNVSTDSNGKADISFYNNGSCKHVNISMETVTQNGIIGTFNK